MNNEREVIACKMHIAHTFQIPGTGLKRETNFLATFGMGSL